MNIDISRVINMYCNEGLSQEEIAKRLGCSRKPISKMLRENNIPLRKEKFTEYGKNKLRERVKDKTFEEIYGEERAKQMKQHLSLVHSGEKCYWYGKHHSEETKTKISQNKDRSLKISKSNKGKKLSESHKENIGKANKGRITSEETKKKLSISHFGEKNYFYGKHLSEEHKLKLSKANLGRVVSEETRKKLCVAQSKRFLNPKEREKVTKHFKGLPKSKEHKLKIGISNLGKNKGKYMSEDAKIKTIETKRKKGSLNHSEETKRKMRISAINYIKKTLGDFKHEMFPNVGHNEKQLLDELEQKMNTKILRQFEVEGYFIDGYIPKMKIAIEIDEPNHYNNGTLKEKDIKRQNTIEKALSCKFIRIKDF